ncbi:DUF3131 domain-containing protein [Beggiatoa leptomitoformis]|uniref:DUF3131 domain-containing protein n=1 Tax=Beggiatoa leptomitoformis TaxID=288004 RepID=A0A2N9YID0_9GAMM|nr:DUF3131 domain-containing protein [Beggiatoa leptomitoformis]ALG67472.1 DUF3131 domain-containing protein [Beggiatoa leptomitoformis]AUI70311.1 DUF3131 domain-containing protein [Beggiatoa leptomitoformis]
MRYFLLIFNSLFLVACNNIYSPSEPVPSPLPTHSSSITQDALQHATEFRKPAPLTAKERQMAQIAWRYFENNYQAKTGFVNAVQDYPSVTMWDAGSYLGGLMAAQMLDLIDATEFDDRLTTLLTTLSKLDLFRGELPNKVYHTQTTEKVNYANQPGEIGFSALDLGRMLILFKIIKLRYPAPKYADLIDSFVLRWNFCNMIDKNGMMFGAHLNDQQQTVYVQEGRLGYEEYAAKGFQLWGFKTPQASKVEPYKTVSIYDIDIPYDSRDPRELVAHNYVVTESYVLDALELNWNTIIPKSPVNAQHTDTFMLDFAKRVYAVQEARYRQTGIFTARTEHQLDSDPYFVYDTIYTDGFPWNTITETGKNVPQFSAVALKGALGLWAVWDTPYTNSLFNFIAEKHDPTKGFYEGVYEDGRGVIQTFTSNNNGIMLEGLLYKTMGHLLAFDALQNPPEGLWEKTLKTDAEKVGKQCLTGH